MIFGGEDPSVGPPAQPITLTYAQASTTPRQPLEGQSGSGTSSARPANLRSFATNSAGANEGLAPHPGLLRDAYSSFTRGCGWGSLSADGVWAGFDAYLTANGNDVIWANTVAAAFEAAGSDDVVTASNAAITQTLAAAGVHAERQDLQIDPPQAYGAPPTTGYANDPVNTATGNFLEPESPGNARLRRGHRIGPFHRHRAEVSRLRTACHIGDIVDAQDPFVHVGVDHPGAESNLDGAPRQRLQVGIPLGIPLDTHRTGLLGAPPRLMRAVYVRLKVAQGCQLQRPVEPHATDPHCQDALLTELGGPPGAAHHPEEGRLDPRHPVALERRHESADRHRGVRDRR